MKLKRILSLILCLIMIVPFAACNNDGGSDEKDEETEKAESPAGKWYNSTGSCLKIDSDGTWELDDGTESGEWETTDSGKIKFTNSSDDTKRVSIKEKNGNSYLDFGDFIFDDEERNVFYRNKYPESAANGGSEEKETDADTFKEYDSLSETQMTLFRGIKEETGFDPVADIIETHETTVSYRGIVTKRNTYDALINIKYLEGVIYMTFTPEEFNEIQKWQKDTGTQVIYPYVDPEDINGIDNKPYIWYKVDDRGIAQLDQNGSFIPAYSSDTYKEGLPYDSIRISSDDGSFIYSVAAKNGGVKCRVGSYAYKYIYRSGES